MKASQKLRHRLTRRNPSGSAGQPRLSWKLKGLLVLSAILIAGWLFFDFSRNSGSPSVQSSATLPQPSPSNASPAGRAGRNDEAFSSQVNRGNELLAQGKPAEAVKTLTEAMRMNPENEDVHYDLALALARQGKTEEAIQQYNEALRLFPNYVEAHNNLGNLLMRIGRTDEAIQHFQKALQIMPDYASAHNNLGTALQKSGRMDEALLHFQKAAKLNPDYWEAHFNVATTYLQQGQTTEARRELETVLRLRPDFQPAKSALAQLEVAPKPAK